MKRKAIFLDRDGVLNRELGNYVTQLEDFDVLEYNIPAIVKLKEKGYIFIIITNQGGIAKGLYNDEQLAVMHDTLQKRYQEEGISFEEIYYCRHQPQFVGQCLCRKPDSIMIEKAISRFNIAPEVSYFIGDKERDIICGEKAGVKGILIESNQCLLDIVHLIE